MMTARKFIGQGNDWGDETARLSLPILLERAIENRPITYGDLREELTKRHNHERKHPLNYGGPAGKIGDAFIKLSKEWSENVPPLNAILVNAKTGVPGHGCDSYLRKFVRKDQLGKLSEADMRAMAESTMEAVFNYSKHDAVARYFDLTLSSSHASDDNEPIVAPPRKPFGDGGESKAHKALKAWAASNPAIFERHGAKKPGRTEFQLESGDEIDVLFQGKKTWLGLEVKTADAPDSELWRGVFQCVKYRATLRAMRKVSAEIPQASVVLVLERQPSYQVKAAAKRLDVAWMNVAPLRK